jgi:hypothetical protein
MGNGDILKQLNKLQTEVEKFVTQYELDMRGDKQINGQKGIVNEIREIKKFHVDYPSILWLLKHKTGRTTLTIFGLGIFIYIIGTVLLLSAGPTALIKALLNLLNIPLL